MIEIQKIIDDIQKNVDEYATLQRSIKRIELDAASKIDEIKKTLKKKIKPEELRLKALAAEIEAQALEHRSILFEGEKKSCELPSGIIAFRLVKKVKFSNVMIDSILKKLEEIGLYHCIKTAKTVDKEALEKLDDITLTNIGVERVEEESFSITTNEEVR